MAKPAEMTWDLSPLYAGADDPRWEEDLTAVREQADEFRRDYRGRIASESLTPELLATALRSYERLQTLGLRPYLFAQLLFSADSGAAKNRALIARAREAWTAISEEVLFFELEIVRLDEEQFARLLHDPEVAAVGHYLQHLRAQRPYTLAEEVEQVLRRKDLTGREGFVQLFEELTASFSYRFRFPGEEAERDTTGEDLLALLHHPDGETRERAFAVFLEKHAENGLVLATCFNNILLDHAKEVELRRYPDIMTPTHLGSETEPEMVERLMAVSEANYGLAREYFEIKRRLLGLGRMKNTDIYAPLGETRHYDFNEARELVIASFAEFSPRLAETAEAFFRELRIDVPPRPGKSGGAFCTGMLPGIPPYVLLNYTGTLRDVATLAHELGHGVHFALSQGQSLFHYQAPLPMAETASVFGEMLLTRRLLDREANPQVKIELLCARLEDIIATTFRQNMLTRFELAAHRRRAGGLLAAEDYCDLWWEENARLFGDAVEMIPAYRWGWSYISHFIHARFYCYSYVFGELLTLALYQKYVEEGSAFVPRYLDLLAAGGSRPPKELLLPLGIDLDDPEFWQKGYDLVGGLLAELKGMISSGGDRGEQSCS